MTRVSCGKCPRGVGRQRRPGIVSTPEGLLCVLCALRSGYELRPVGGPRRVRRCSRCGRFGHDSRRHLPGA